MGNANTERSALWKALKELGWEPEKPFVNYSVERLREIATQYSPGSPVEAVEASAFDYGALPALELPEPPTAATAPSVPLAGPDPQEMPGQRTNTKAEDEPIRVDEQGRLWYQEEVLKPSYPKPRGRRVLRYQETGIEQQTVQDGQYTETFEVAGSGPGVPAEIKITLPSYQVGIYRDRRFPFKIHTYNGFEGFDLYEVEDFYGGPELVPADVKRVYVENHLCYDIRSVIRSIQAEHRQYQLTGRI